MGYVLSRPGFYKLLFYAAKSLSLNALVPSHAPNQIDSLLTWFESQ
jgi:hypothetical protein